MRLPGPLMRLPGPLMRLPGPLMRLPGPLMRLPGPLMRLPGPLCAFDSAALHLTHGLRPMKKGMGRFPYVPAQRQSAHAFFRTAHCLRGHYTTPPAFLTRRFLHF
jgi:hypothetical protein